MPWSSQNGGGWKSSGGGPWGQGPGNKGGGNDGDGPNQPDIEDLLKRSQDRLKKAMPGGQKGPPLLGGGLMTVIGLIGAAALLFLMFTVRVLPDEQGVVLRFGKIDRQLGPGIAWRLPYPIEEVYRPKVSNIQKTSIGYLGSEASRFGRNIPNADVSGESLMLTSDENIVDIDFVVQWYIKDASKYLFNIRNPQRTVKDVSESAMREIVGKNRFQTITSENRTPLETAVAKLVQKTLDDYQAGIEIRDVKMLKALPPKDVEEAFKDVNSAKQDQVRYKQQAREYANKVIPEARGDAQAIIERAKAYRDQTVKEAEGEASRFEKVFSEYEKAPEITRKRMFLETMERVISGAENTRRLSGRYRDSRCQNAQGIAAQGCGGGV